MKTGICFNGLFLTTMLVSFSRNVSAGEEEQPVGKGCVAFEAGPSLQQDRIGDEGFVGAGVTARPHQVKGAQILKPESITRRHGRACHFRVRSV